MKPVAKLMLGYKSRVPCLLASPVSCHWVPATGQILDVRFRPTQTKKQTCIFFICGLLGGRLFSKTMFDRTRPCLTEKKT